MDDVNRICWVSALMQGYPIAVIREAEEFLNDLDSQSTTADPIAELKAATRAPRELPGDDDNPDIVTIEVENCE